MLIEHGTSVVKMRMSLSRKCEVEWLRLERGQALEPQRQVLRHWFSRGPSFTGSHNARKGSTGEPRAELSADYAIHVACCRTTR